MKNLYKNGVELKNPNELADEFISRIKHELNMTYFSADVTDVDICNAIIKEAKSLKARLCVCDICDDRYFTDNDYIYQNKCQACNNM